MCKDYISCVNLWCQKNEKAFPEYSFTTENDEWYCTATAEWLSEPINSNSQASKKLAKQECTAGVYKICQNSKEIVHVDPGTCIIIDGDQRADCWRWLAELDTNGPIKVYTGPTTPVIEGGKTIEHIRAESPSADAADAKILMDLGGFIATRSYERYILVSSDHILVQVASNVPNIVSAGNLAQLKKILCKG